MSDILTSLGAPVNTSTTDALAAIAQDSGLVGPDLAAAIGASPATVALLRQGASAEAIIRAWGFEHPFTPAVSAERSSASSESPTIEVLPWEDFLPWWSDAWEPGQHVGIVGPTGSGKTTLEFGLCQTTDYVLAIDPKGGDQTLAASGWRRVTTWPPPSGVIARVMPSIWEKSHE